MILLLEDMTLRGLVSISIEKNHHGHDFNPKPTPNSSFQLQIILCINIETKATVLHQIYTTRHSHFSQQRSFHSSSSLECEIWMPCVMKNKYSYFEVSEGMKNLLIFWKWEEVYGESGYAECLMTP